MATFAILAHPVCPDALLLISLHLNAWLCAARARTSAPSREKELTRFHFNRISRLRRHFKGLRSNQDAAAFLAHEKGVNTQGTNLLQVQDLLRRAEECDRKALFAKWAELRNTFMDLAEEYRALARKAKAMEPD